VDLERIAILHIERIGGILGIDTATIEEEADLVESLALSFAESVHQLVQRGGALDLEVDLVIVVRDLNVEVFAGRWSLLLLARSTRASVRVRSRHGCGIVVSRVELSDEVDLGFLYGVRERERGRSYACALKLRNRSVVVAVY